MSEPTNELAELQALHEVVRQDLRAKNLELVVERAASLAVRTELAHAYDNLEATQRRCSELTQVSRAAGDRIQELLRDVAVAKSLRQ